MIVRLVSTVVIQGCPYLSLSRLVHSVKVPLRKVRARVRLESGGSVKRVELTLYDIYSRAGR